MGVYEAKLREETQPLHAYVLSTIDLMSQLILTLCRFPYEVTANTFFSISQEIQKHLFLEEVQNVHSFFSLGI